MRATVWLWSAVFSIGWPVAAGAATLPLPAPATVNDLSAPGAQDARQVRDWIRAHADNRSDPFAVIDKRNATLHIFDPAGQWLASTPVLLGLAVGDQSVPGIGERRMADIKPQERTTPSGRFASEPGLNLQGEDIVWIDYDAAISMHRVRTANKADRRLQRLATPTVSDNRISYGCVNVPAAFYDRFVKPGFGKAAAVVYVLPETQTVSSWLQTLKLAR